MNANEIRIGNWFKHKANEWSVRNEPMIEGAIIYFQWEESDWYCVGESTLSLDVIEPIPLTEEWLNRLLFTWDSVTWSIGDCLMLSADSNNDYAIFLNSLTHGKLKRKIKYVHQLQNLYFELEGKELPIKN